MITPDKIPGAEILPEFRALYAEEKLWIAVIQKALTDYINWEHFSRYERGHIANIRERKQERVKSTDLEANHQKAYELLEEFIFTENHKNCLANIIQALPLAENPDCVIESIRIKVKEYADKKKYLNSFTGIVD